MSTADLFNIAGLPHQPRISFELYPPRTVARTAAIHDVVSQLTDLRPDFFSVTYGASGSSREASADLVQHILTTTDIPPIAHLTCVDASRDQLQELVAKHMAAGVRDFLALRGDPPAGQLEWVTPAGGLGRAVDLVALIRATAREVCPDQKVSVSVAAYPGGRFDDAGHPIISATDLAALAQKQEAGADFAITQVFFSARHYINFVSQARKLGITIPIVPGIIPLTDLARLRRLEQLTGVPVPATLAAMLESAPDEHTHYQRGLGATVGLINEVLAAGAPGLHLYTFNNPSAALDIVHSARLIESSHHDA